MTACRPYLDEERRWFDLHIASTSSIGAISTHDHGLLHLHNPSGHTEAARRAILPIEVFATFFSGRGIAVTPAVEHHRPAQRRLLAGEYELRSVAADADHSAAIPGGVLVLDVAVTPELLLEGVAARRHPCRPADQAPGEVRGGRRVRVRIEGGEEVAAAVAAHRDLIAAETLADEVRHVPGASVVARVER
ncbi:hypothetical protein AB0G06_37090 [Nonomuraea dietziae]|uniref:hypothetical protein n=1 Tax=Nonomuraea dietziae TaxID=65515 RepID=UPI0033FD9E0B